VAEHRTRKLAVILHADVVGSTALVQYDEALAHERIRDVFHRFSATIESYNGHPLELRGDALVAEFNRASDAVEASLAFQAENTRFNATLEDEVQPTLRVGISLGEVVIADNTITGEGIVLAQRLEQLASGGGVCIQGAVYEAVPGRLPFAYESLGEQKLKGFSEPVRAYAVSLKSGEAIPPPEVHAIPGEAQPERWKQRWIVAGTMALLVIAGGGLAWLQPWVHRVEPASIERMAFPLPDKPSLAVLPFTNLSGDPEQEYFADGMTDDLITDLSKISALFVIARNSSFTYRGKSVDVKRVGRELGVKYVLEGSVRHAGDRVRINAQLIDSETGGHLWADRFERDASNIFTVQDEVIRHIVDALAVQLSASEQQRLERLPTTNLEAYDYYLRAEQAARASVRPQLREALRLYEKATALDATFAEAFAADAWTAAYVMRNNYDGVLPGPVARKRAYEHAGRGLAIDPEASLPFSVLAVLQVVDGRHEEALTSAERAVALGPSDAEAHAALSLVLTFSSRHADAVAAIETAIRLNPSLSPSDRVVAGLAYLVNDEPERAIEMLERARTEAPNVDDTHSMLTAAYARAGRMDAARRAAAEAVRLGPNLCVELYRMILGHFRSSQDLAKILDAMRAGGLPEWPYGFSADPRDRLAAAEIGRLAFGRTWQGRMEGGGPALAQIEPDGKLAFRTATYIATGVAFVSGDMLCERIEALSLGRPVCGPVYRLSKPSGEDDLAYAYANASKVFHFSPVE